MPRKNEKSANATLSRTKKSPWVDPDDAPELTDEFLDRAEFRVGNKLIRRGRPPLERPRVATKLRLSQDVLDHFRGTGAGWQTRINETLERHVARAKKRADA